MNDQDLIPHDNKIKDNSFDYKKLFSEIEMVNSLEKPNPLQHTSIWDTNNYSKSLQASMISLVISLLLLLPLLYFSPHIPNSGLLFGFPLSFSLGISFSMLVASLLMFIRKNRARKGLGKSSTQEIFLPQPISYCAQIIRNTSRGILEADIFRLVPETSENALNIRKEKVSTVRVGEGSDITGVFDNFDSLSKQLENYNQSLLQKYNVCLNTMGIDSRRSEEVESYFRAKQELTAEQNQDSKILEPCLNQISLARTSHQTAL